MAKNLSLNFLLGMVGIYLDSYQIFTILPGITWISTIPPGSRWNMWGRVKYCLRHTASQAPTAPAIAAALLVVLVAVLVQGEGGGLRRRRRW